jgi:7-cyano-7-deazaguanine synthase
MTKAAPIRAIVVLSGGMDSTVCATLAVKEYGAESVAALHVNYGQRTETRERLAFEAICDRLGITRRLVVRNQALSQIGGSALTDSKINVPEAGPEIGNEVPITYVPFRNAHFLTVAVSWAEVVGAEKIYIGAVQQDSSGYPDCRPEYYEAFNEVIRQGTKEGLIRIVTPLIAMKKVEIVQLGLELAAPFDLTWSCYSREDSACGACESCVLRLRAFAAAGSVDPIPYLPQAARR